MQRIRLPFVRVVVLSTVLTSLGCAPAADEATPLGAEVQVEGGTISGLVHDSGLKTWHQIPYAAPPMGDLRWRPPQPVVRWEGLRSATTPGPACQQLPGEEGGFYTSELGAVSEDCLTLNVWSEAKTADERRPVMYWIHGGALVTGSGSDYDGTLLASKGVVLVTVNYRLGPFGFFTHPELTEEGGGRSGNQGLLDQIAGLHWVRDNIAQFGGDPDNVTIFGESAGSHSVSLVQASPLAKGLFHRAIGQSGGSFHPMTWLAEATSYKASSHDLNAPFAAAVAEAGNLADASLASLRKASVESILATAPLHQQYDDLAVVDGFALPNEVAAIFAAGQQSDVPTLTGSNKDEGSAFGFYFEPIFGKGIAGRDTYASVTFPEMSADVVAATWPASNDEEGSVAFQHLFADGVFTYPQRMWARGMATVSSPAYLYYFTWEPPVSTPGLGSFHAAEIPYIFDQYGTFGIEATDADRAFADLMSDIWVRFATTGNPNGEGLPEWPAFTAENEAYMELGPEIRVGENLRMEQVQAIHDAFTARRTQADAASGG